MAELTFAAPDDGVWSQDSTHFPRPVTRLLQEAFREGFITGIASGTACYGLLLEHIEPAFVNGFFYCKDVIVGAPPDAKGPPPEAVFKSICASHPQIVERLQSAASVFTRKPWREHLEHWDTVLKPRSRENHLRLQSVDLAGLSDEALAAHLDECFDNSKAMAWQHHIYTVSCGIPVGDFVACVQQWTGMPAAPVLAILRGSTPVSSGINDELLAALHAIAVDETATAALRAAGEPGAILRNLRALPGAAGTAVGAWLDLVGHHVIGGYDVSCPTALETPGVLLAALRQGHSSQAQAAVEQQVREQTSAIRAAVPEQHRAQFDELLDEARRINRLRDERAWWSDLWASGIFRGALLEAGRRLRAAGRIAQVEHVLDTSFAELRPLLTGAGNAPVPDAAELAARHQFRSEVSASAAPPTLNGTPSGPPPLEWFPENTRRTMRAMNTFMANIFGGAAPASDARIVRGLAVSAGVYEGRARVIESAEALNQVQRGEVLVARSTSTSFNYVLPLVGAIVTDRGGLMSHAAIVAREYGLPAVVGCQVATRTIPDGATVRVDADKGEVTIL